MKITSKQLRNIVTSEVRKMLNEGVVLDKHHVSILL